MDTTGTAGPLRWMRRTLALALILLIGAFAAGSFNAYPIADPLLALAGINAAAGLVLMKVIRHRLRSYVRTLQVQQQAELDSTFHFDTR
jgi:uncharacterized membrane protein